MRSRPAVRAVARTVLALGLATAGTAGLLGCTGAGDPTSAVQPGAEGTFFEATITLLDVGTPCRPGISCAPEFYDCDGVSGITIPATWSFRADEAAAGVIAYQSVAEVGNPNGVFVVRGTDTGSDTSVSLAFSVDVNAAAGTWTEALSPGREGLSTYGNVDARCTTLNAALDPVSLFTWLPAEPGTIDVSLPLTAIGDVQFSEPTANGLSPDYVEGTFSFVAENSQQLAQLYLARVLVEGCFRVQMPRIERGVELDPSASGGC